MTTKLLDEDVGRTQPSLENPPAGLGTEQDVTSWELYDEYYNERIGAIRADFQATGSSDRNLPVSFDVFIQRYAENSELLPLLRGRLARGGMGRIIDEITDGATAQNLGLSRVEQPVAEEMVYLDFVWRGQSGYTAVSMKSRDFRGLVEDFELGKIQRIVRDDVDECVKKYLGRQYVRRRGLPQTGTQIDIAEVVLNYDPRFLPEGMKGTITDLIANYENPAIKPGFFGFHLPAK